MKNRNQGMKRWPGVLLLACGLALAGPVFASGKVAVEDTEAQERIEKVRKQIEELQKKLININDSKTASWESLKLTGTDAGLFENLAKLSDSEITTAINWECGEDPAYSGSVADLLKRYVPPARSTLNKPEPIKAEQRKICQHKVATQLWRSNLTMALKERLVAHEKLLNEILAKTDMAQRNTDLAGFSAIVQADLNYTQAALAAYDGRLAELAEQRTLLNDVALNGPKSNGNDSTTTEGAVGQLVGGTLILKGALEAAKLLVEGVGL